jgi:phospholipid/cholesterol/gamma-HCH transport system ATP-binding protein
VIRLEHVFKSFDGRKVLIDYNLTVHPGETFVVMGPSGSGKSVTLKHIVGLLTPESGKVTVNGLDVVAADRRKLREARSQIGYMFQSGALLNWMTVGQNVALPLIEKRDRSMPEIQKLVYERLKDVNMAGEVHKYPAEISGGMRKRAALARVLVQEPKILLYDEPTAGLDPRMSATIGNLINDVRKKFGVTSIVVTHDLRLAFDVASRIGFMHLGRLLEIDEPTKLRASRNPVVRDFLEGRPFKSVDEETGVGNATQFDITTT